MKVWLIEQWDEGTKYPVMIVDSLEKAKLECDGSEGWRTYDAYEVE